MIQDPPNMSREDEEKHMAVIPYCAEYCRFDTEGESSGAYLLGADSIVGDLLEIIFETNEENQSIAKLRNRFGKEVGFFDKGTTYRLLLCQADGWEVHAILSAVFLSTSAEGGAHYSGEAIVMCFSKRYSKEFNVFMDGIRDLASDGKRPDVELKTTMIRNVIDKGGNWIPQDSAPKRKLDPGTVIVKNYIKPDEKMIEMARNRNVGCMAVGWFFIIITAIGVIWLLSRLFL